jgi:hypothetical protein
MLAADYNISACFRDSHGLFVNLYIPATVSWRQADAACRMTLSTDYPYASTVTMNLQMSQPQTFALRLRIPDWAAGASISVNGKRSSEPVVAGTFAGVVREWRSGDRIELDLPLRLRLQAVDAEHPDKVALFAGPLVLMRILDEEQAATPAIARSALLGAARDAGDTHRWNVSQDSRKFELRAFADIDAQRYSTYQDVTS